MKEEGKISKRKIFKITKCQPKSQVDRISWLKEHDDNLKEIVSRNGERNWDAIGDEMRKMFPSFRITGKKCRERWINVHKHGISRMPLEDNERLMMIVYHHLYSSQWSMIVKKMGQRNPCCIKNNFYSLLKKVIREISNLKPEKGKLEPSAYHFCSALYVIKCILPHTGDIFERRKCKEGLTGIPLHILDFLEGTGIVKETCEDYFASLKKNFLACSSLLGKGTAEKMESETLDSTLKKIEPLFLEITALRPFQDPELVITRALDKVFGPPQSQPKLHPRPEPFMAFTQKTAPHSVPLFPQFASPYWVLISI